MILEGLENLLGPAPEGLEWLAYFFCFVLLLIGLHITFKMIEKFFSFFTK